MEQATQILEACGLYDRDLKTSKTPVDIVGMNDLGKKLASELAKIVGAKEVRYYDETKNA